MTRSELARAEAAYAKWIAGNAETRVEAFHHVFRLGELPSTAKLKAAACGGRADKPTPSWWRLLTQLQCAVSRDFEDKDPEELNPEVPLGIPDNPESVVYRIPRLATITHWSAKPPTGQDPQDPDAKWKDTEVLRERRKVVIVQGTESHVPLRPMRTRTLRKDKPLGDSDTGLTFDADGILSKVSTKRTDPSLERAATLAQLPEDIRSGISAGRAVLKPLTPEGETARLKAQADLIDARKALKKAQAPSPDDPLADLKADVEESQLQVLRPLRRRHRQRPDTQPCRSHSDTRRRRQRRRSLTSAHNVSLDELYPLRHRRSAESRTPDASGIGPPAEQYIGRSYQGAAGSRRAGSRGP